MATHQISHPSWFKWLFGISVKAYKAYSLIELILVVLIIAVLAAITVPRLQFAAVHQKNADTTARKIVTDLWRTRSRAILYAKEKPQGFALNMIGSDPYTGYRITDISDSNIIDSYTIDSSINCTGGSQFEFGPLGNLKDDSDTQLTVSGGGKSFTITIVSATGMVKCVKN
jgi:prepilin-type N-terminal cleavage/methylation domain-containing protein